MTAHFGDRSGNSRTHDAVTHIHTEADLDAGTCRARQSRSAVCPADGESGTAAVAAAGRWLCRPRRDHRGAAAFDRERQRDLGTAGRGLRSVRAGSDPARARRRGWRGLGCPRPKSARSRKSPAPSQRGELALAALGELPAEEAHAALTAVHGIGPWTADIYLLVLPRPCRRLAGRRPRLAGSRQARFQACRHGRPPRRCRPWPNRGGRGAPSRPEILWSYYRTAITTAKASRPKSRDLRPRYLPGTVWLQTRRAECK